MKLRWFNLIEITMALAIIGVGVAAVISVFPVALDNTRVAVAENYASTAADYFYSYVFYAIKTTDEEDLSKSLSELISEDIKPAALEPVTVESEGSFTPVKDYEDNLAVSSIPGLFRFTQGNNPENYDFEAVIRVWRDVNGPPGMAILGKDGNPEVINVSSDSFSGVFVEVSWPAYQPYDRREKHTYYREISN